MNAWVTLLSDDGYLPGVLALKRSLSRVETIYPLIVMVTDFVPQETRQLLRDEGCLVREVFSLLPPAGTSIDYASPQFGNTWTKLRVWEQEDIETAVLLDADMLILRNMDELFDIALPEGGIAACHACLCNPHNRPDYPAHWVPENCAYTHTHTSQDMFPAAEKDHLNSGLVVLKPDRRVFDALWRRLSVEENAKSFSFADQDLINQYFSGNWLIMPYIYNALKTLSKCHSDMWALDDVKNIHYIIGKTWDLPPSDQNEDPYAELNAIWWKIYLSAPKPVESE